ncbi:ATP-binding protein [Viscerimonas tarda]
MSNLQNYIGRNLELAIYKYLAVFPAVLILGPRQCGKSTLVKILAREKDNILYLDLQNRSDLNKLTEPSLFFKSNKDAVICLDEIQLVPQLFSVLRSEIDSDRRASRFILLGSASQELIQETSESLAGRIGILELTPFLISELAGTSGFSLEKYWNRGAFPDSFLAINDEASCIWRENFIKTYVQRDLPQLGIQIPALQMQRFMTLCAHFSGQILNTSKIGDALGVSHTTVRRYIDLLEQTFLARTLLPYETNMKKRMVKSPKFYIRDTGILHQLLQIKDYNSLLGNPVLGASWEGLVIENICSALPDARFSFYRSATGDEIDLIIRQNSKTIAVECKASVAPQLAKGFWNAIEIVKPQKSFVVSPVAGNYPVKENVFVCGLNEAVGLIENELNSIS